MNPNLLVYVAGPFSAKDREGVEANIRAAVDVGLEVARAGFCPVIPHANTAHPMFEALKPYTFWITATAAQLRTCHAVVLVPGWQHSSGACGEVEIALLRGIPVIVPERLLLWHIRVPWSGSVYNPMKVPAAFLEAA